MLESRWRPTRFVRASIALHALVLVIVIVWPGQWRWALAALLVNHALLGGFGLWPRSHWLGANWTRLPAAAAARNEIALTLDDGPDPAVTPQVLDLLDRHAVRATFFCCGERAAQFPDLCREIVRRGHAVENHSQRHRHNFSLLDYGACLREVQAGQETLTAITGQRPQFFRAPAGLRNFFLDPVLERLELQLVSWSVRAYDTRVGRAERVRSTLLGGMRAGAILLLHDGNAARTRAGVPVILEVLPAILSSAATAGLRFVTLRDAMPIRAGS